MKKCSVKYKENMIKLFFTMQIVAVIILNINHSYASVTKNFIVKESMKEEFMQEIGETLDEKFIIKDIEINELDTNYIEKEIIETKLLNQNSREYIYSQFGKTKTYNDGIYKGELEIANYNIKNIDNGYHEEIEEKILEFEKFSDNDLNNIEKEITIDNNKYVLINVEWYVDDFEKINGVEVPVTYKGKKVYQRIKQVKNPDTYKVNVTYKGKVELKDKLYNYNVVYNEIVEDVEPEEKQIINETKTNIVTPIIISGIGITIFLLYLVKNKNNKRQKGEKNNKSI